MRRAQPTGSKKKREERTWTNRVASEFVFHSVHPDTDAPLHEERVTAVRPMERGHPGFLVLVVSQSSQEMFKKEQKVKNAVQPVHGKMKGWIDQILQVEPPATQGTWAPLVSM